MTHKITISESFRHRGKHGVVVFIDAHVDGHDGRYSFPTHNLTPQEIRARRDEFIARHAAKAQRLNGLRDVYKTKIRSGYTIRDCTISERSGTVVDLVLRLTGPGGEVIVADRSFNDVSSVPTDNEIIKIARDAAVAHANRQKVAEDHVRSVKQVLGL